MTDHSDCKNKTADHDKYRSEYERLFGKPKDKPASKEMSK